MSKKSRVSGDRDLTPEESERLFYNIASRRDGIPQIPETDAKAMFRRVMRQARRPIQSGDAGLSTLPGHEDEHGDPAYVYGRAEGIPCYTDIQVRAGLINLIDAIERENSIDDYEGFYDCITMLNIPENPDNEDIDTMMREFLHSLMDRGFVMKSEADNVVMSMSHHVLQTIKHTSTEKIARDAMRFQATYFSDDLPKNDGSPSAEAS